MQAGSRPPFKAIARMNNPSRHMSPALYQCIRTYRRYLTLFFALTAIALGMLFLPLDSPPSAFVFVDQLIAIPSLIKLLFAGVTLVAVWALLAAGIQILRHLKYLSTVKKLSKLHACESSDEIKRQISAVSQGAGKEPLLKVALEETLPALYQHLERLNRQAMQRQLEVETDKALQEIDERLERARGLIPLIKGDTALRESLETLKTRRHELAVQWDRAYAKFSWWNKLTLSAPDFREMEGVIMNIERMHVRFSKYYADEFARLDEVQDETRRRSVSRINFAKSGVEQYIAEYAGRDPQASVTLKSGFWLAGFSLPISAWGDVVAAGEIYDTLREVSGRYANMSDIEIWWHAVLMPSEQLAGLTSLVKGAYFEKLVAVDTGGALQEHFNTPVTDIVIDGEAFQIKATDNVGYVAAVDPDVPVIATSEVAEITRAIDSGYSDAELERAVDLALGGSVIDAHDTVVDAMLGAVGGFGLLASLKGVNHAAEKYNNGGDGVEAVFEGVGVAIEGTARALVGTAELGYKVLASRPSRFAGRVLLAGLKKIDDKLFDPVPKK